MARLQNAGRVFSDERGVRSLGSTAAVREGPSSAICGPKPGRLKADFNGAIDPLDTSASDWGESKPYGSRPHPLGKRKL